METASDLLFRCHYMGDVMSGTGKGWTVEESLTCKRKLVQIYRSLKYGRTPDYGNKYTEKGTEVEEDGLTLLSAHRNTLLLKNKERLFNLFLTGELDTFIGEYIKKAEETIDVKCSWDLFTFPSFLDKTDSDYDYQGQGYMALTGAKKHTVSHCLVNTPARLINDQKYALRRKMGIIDIETDEYIEQCIEIEKNGIFDMELFKKHNPFYDLHCPESEWKYDIPAADRVHEVTLERKDEVIEAMYKRIRDCRKWMNEKLFRA